MEKSYQDQVKDEVIRLRDKFGDLAPLVVDEILDKAATGYDYDAEAEIPFYTAVKEVLQAT